MTTDNVSLTAEGRLQELNGDSRQALYDVRAFLAAISGLSEQLELGDGIDQLQRLARMADEKVHAVISAIAVAAGERE